MPDVLTFWDEHKTVRMTLGPDCLVNGRSLREQCTTESPLKFSLDSHSIPAAQVGHHVGMEGVVKSVPSRGDLPMDGRHSGGRQLEGPPMKRVLTELAFRTSGGRPHLSKPACHDQLTGQVTASSEGRSYTGVPSISDGRPLDFSASGGHSLGRVGSPQVLDLVMKKNRIGENYLKDRHSDHDGRHPNDGRPLGGYMGMNDSYDLMPPLIKDTDSDSLGYFETQASKSKGKRSKYFVSAIFLADNFCAVDTRTNRNEGFGNSSFTSIRQYYVSPLELPEPGFTWERISLSLEIT